jgi:beta-glucosidase
VYRTKGVIFESKKEFGLLSFNSAEVSMMIGKVKTSAKQTPVILIAVTFAFAFSWEAPAQTGSSAQQMNRSPEERAAELVRHMTLEEKAAQTMNGAPAIPRLGIPAYDYWNEGLHGIARSGYSTLFPQAIGMAATWDAPLLGQIGEVVSTEARAKYNDAISHGIHSIYFGLTIWSPNINIFRDPRWGRGQETYGEDPFLTGQLALGFIRGLQGPDPLHPRAIATPKHFAVHSGPESERHSFDIKPSPHDLWDTYLPQFRTAIVDGKANSIMCAYNAVDGQPACASDLLLKDVLRGKWSFTGFVTSDCGAIDDFFQKKAHNYAPDEEHAAATGVLAGTDTNCGSTYRVLPLAVKQGLIEESDLDHSLMRLFTARFRLGLFDPPKQNKYAQIPFGENRKPEHLALSLQASRESMVLLKNDGILPLARNKYKNVVVIGPNAASLSALEGNYNAVPQNPSMPIDVLREALAESNVIYSQGAPYVDGVLLPVPRTMLHPSADSKEFGLKAEYFRGDTGDMMLSFNVAPVTTRVDKEIQFDWNSAAPVPGLKQDAFAVRWVGVIVPPRPGKIDFSIRLAHCHPCGDKEYFAMRIDGRKIGELETPGTEDRESSSPRFSYDFVDSKPHTIELIYTHYAPLFGGGLTLEWVPPDGVLQADAAKVAQSADLVIAMVGLSPELEGEEMKVQVEGFSGGDRTDITLPASQVKMLEEVVATGKPMVVVLLNGSALAVKYAQERANAVLEAWYPGEFGGRAIADTLLGTNNPAGRLPVTFYADVHDLPAFTDYSMQNRTYRYFKGTPLYRFGYGLSYTTFAYSRLKLSAEHLRAGQPLTAEVDVKNTGPVSGDEVAQLYLLPPRDGNRGLSPMLQLAGFQRFTLKAGEQRHLTFSLDDRALSEVDAEGTRSVQAGKYSIAIGGAQPIDRIAPSKAVEADFSIERNAPVAP